MLNRNCADTSQCDSLQFIMHTQREEMEWGGGERKKGNILRTGVFVEGNDSSVFTFFFKKNTFKCFIFLLLGRMNLEAMILQA